MRGSFPFPSHRQTTLTAEVALSYFHSERGEESTRQKSYIQRRWFAALSMTGPETDVSPISVTRHSITSPMEVCRALRPHDHAFDPSRRSAGAKCGYGPA